MNFTEITSILGIATLGYGFGRLIEYLLLRNYNKKKDA